jgi:hypothetical protein
MSAERRCDVVDEQGACLLWFRERRAQGRKQALCDRILDTLTRLQLKIVDWSGADLIGNAIQSFARQIEMQDVKWILEVNDRVPPQVVNLNHSCSTVHARCMSALVEVFAPRALAQSQLYQVGVVVRQRWGHAVVRCTLNLRERQGRFIELSGD